MQSGTIARDQKANWPRVGQTSFFRQIMIEAVARRKPMTKTIPVTAAGAARSLPRRATRRRLQGKDNLIAMFRRCVSLLVIAGFLASQLAVIPHTHGAASAEEQREHDATPHCHIGHAHHGHSHAHCGHTHAHSHPGKPTEESVTGSPDESANQPLGAGRCGAEHDASAIFVSGQACTASPASPRDQGPLTWQTAPLAALPGWLGQLAGGVPSSAPRWHPPDEVSDASDIYLTLRTLRI
jgi:hypothetical protein